MQDEIKAGDPSKIEPGDMVTSTDHSADGDVAAVQFSEAVKQGLRSPRLDRASGVGSGFPYGLRLCDQLEPSVAEEGLEFHPTV